MSTFRNLAILGLFLCSPSVMAEVSVHKLDRADVPSIQDISYYPQSVVDRPLILPQKLLEVQGGTEYRQIGKGVKSLALRIRGTYGVMENLEAVVETSVLPMTFAKTRVGSVNVLADDGFQFGGILAGANYSFFPETEQYPEFVGGLKIGIFGGGPLSLTSGSTFSVLPSVKLKKTLNPRLSLAGDFTLSFGNEGSGLYLVEAGGIFKAYDQFDILGSVLLEGIGLDKTIILALKPSVVYHWDNDWDLMGGFNVGLAGGEAVGNNLHLGVARRF